MAALVLAIAAAPALATVEGVTAEGASAEKDSATLNGYYTSADGKAANYYFEWGQTEAYGQTTAAPPGPVAGTEAGFQSVPGVQINGLLGETTYHYRLVVTDADGAVTSGDATFTTAPAVSGLATDPPGAVTNQSAELNASFDGDNRETHYYFEWGPTGAYGNTTPVPPGSAIAPSSGRVNVPPIAISGLQQGATYHYRVVASNALGITSGPDATFKTAEPPVVSGLRTRGVTADSAELVGVVNPNQGATKYRFEWGSTNGYGNSIPVPDGDVGNGSAPVPVSAQIKGLTTGVTYHFRLVASNQYGTVASSDQSLGFYPPSCPNSQLRQETGSNGLPDCRAYELVSPSNTRGTTLYPVNAPSVSHATSPARIAYSGLYGTLDVPGGPSNLSSDLYVSTRTDTGWYQKFVGLPVTEALIMGGPPMDWVANWGTGPRFGPARSFEGAQASPNMDRILSYSIGWPSALYGQRREASNAPYLWDAGTGAELTRWPTNLNQIPGGRGFVGVPQASQDFNHFIFSSNVVFSDDGRGNATSKSIECCPSSESPDPMPKGSIYDNDVRTGKVVLASLKGNNISQFEGYVYDVSDDGSHILMGEEGKRREDRAIPYVLSTGPFYLRVDAARTYEIAPGAPQLRYVGSTADGETFYFTSPGQLTADDHDSSIDLFMWQESQPDALTRVSTGSGGSGDSDVCGASWIAGCGVGIINFYPYEEIDGGAGGHNGIDNFIASDSGDIYFESPEQLTGAKGELGQANLYLYREGSLRYVTTMIPGRRCISSTGCDFPGGKEIASGPVSRMQVTPDGKHMALVTDENLTSYDSNNYREMYTYDPDGDRLTCVSCRPDGKPPVGETPPPVATQWFGTGDTQASQNGLFITDDGRTFFSTIDPLVPRDTNEVRDVYEYTEGKAQLISAGLGEEIPPESGVEGTQNKTGLIAVSANGTDVYFGSIDNLVTQDHNGQQLKIFDARTGGGFPAESVPSNCASADECHGPSSSAPAVPADRTSAPLGSPRKAKAHKAKKKHRARKHKAKKKQHKKKHAKTKAKRTASVEQGRGNRG